MSAPALTSRLNDCRSCYKCIRSCPTKSISFIDGHASIVQAECVYCGRCYIACPQDCKIVRDDLLLARKLVQEGESIPQSSVGQPGQQLSARLGEWDSFLLCHIV